MYRFFAFSICYSYNCCPNLLLEYTSTIRHSFSTLESIQRSPVVIASFSPHAMKLVFSSQAIIILDANFMACMRVGSSSKFFDSSIPIHAKEAENILQVLAHALAGGNWISCKKILLPCTESRKSKPRSCMILQTPEQESYTDTCKIIFSMQESCKFTSCEEACKP